MDWDTLLLSAARTAALATLLGAGLMTAVYFVWRFARALWAMGELAVLTWCYRRRKRG